ncbi:hypothetical protein AB0P17_06490 [Streptomyces sp. NPDC088124]|uniref:hypothetical protein n=1 Tax=Streptomyces sp. NPDC088124 TaxID=3154654 RepID=UPI0034435DC2
MALFSKRLELLEQLEWPKRLELLKWLKWLELLERCVDRGRPRGGCPPVHKPPTRPVQSPKP